MFDKMLLLPLSSRSSHHLRHDRLVLEEHVLQHDLCLVTPARPTDGLPDNSPDVLRQQHLGGFFCEQLLPHVEHLGEVRRHPGHHVGVDEARLDVRHLHLATYQLLPGEQWVSDEIDVIIDYIIMLCSVY